MERVKKITFLVWDERYKVLRFLFSGCLSALVNFFFLYAFTEWFGIYYLFSVVLAFIIAVCVSFAMQKFWTFKNTDKENTHKQMMIYLAVAIFNTIINTSLVYLFVEYLHLHYMLGQFLASGLIAFESFFIYKLIIFKVSDEGSSIIL